MTASRILLENVPKVGFYDPSRGTAPEDVPFPSCLAAAARYLGADLPWLPQPKGAPVNYGYTLLLAASGMAWGLRWKAGWQPDNVDHMFIADPGEIIRRAFGAVGYSYTMLSRDGDPDGPGTGADEARFRTAIIDSLRRGVPVLAFGVVGPPECCLITGYDDDGAVLMGWNFFTQMPPFNAGLAFEPNGIFRKADWFPATHSLLLIGEPVAPAFDLSDTLRWAVTVARQERLWGHAVGHAAYSAWANQLKDDLSDLPEATLRERHDVHNSQVGMLAECRFYGAEFLRYQAGLADPNMAAQLRQAAACFQAEHDLMWQVWDAAGGNGHPDAWANFARPDVRQAIIPLILAAQEQARRGTDLLDIISAM
ncbi:MAG: DNA-binding protein AraC-type [Symbiobacteriaceae bacterium]|nr:DNA-binding protein AraC-type [Symbiobacteriaceae bacterium]